VIHVNVLLQQYHALYMGHHGIPELASPSLAAPSHLVQFKTSTLSCDAGARHACPPCECGSHGDAWIKAGTALAHDHVIALVN
jgi:hypothetical protein